jgi:beta-xylosidase
MRQHGRLAAALAILLITLAGCLPPPPPPPATDANNANPADPNNRWGWFEAGLEWRGDFGDPHVFRAGNTYFAYSSPAGGRYLPVLTSTDLTHWTIHSRWTTNPAPWAGGPDPNTDTQIPAEIRFSAMNPGDKWNMNDGLVSTPNWALWHDQGPWLKRDYWAPGVIKIGTTWYAYSAVKVSNTSDDPHGYGRFCITVATAVSALGPFRDNSGAAPIICDVPDPAGSIDPSPFYDPTDGNTYLLWKAAGRRSQPGVPGYPSALKSIRLGADGKPAPGALPVTLLRTNEGSWEGFTIENPSMVAFAGTYWLFYSGNDSSARPDGSSDYATGYAICPSGPRAACLRRSTTPLLRSNGYVQGPGGASAFVDAAGDLRLAYSYFWLGENRQGTFVAHPRRLKIARLQATAENPPTFVVG